MKNPYIQGLCSLFDFSGSTLKNRTPLVDINGEHRTVEDIINTSDLEALTNDWEMIGCDMQSAIDEYITQKQSELA